MTEKEKQMLYGSINTQAASAPVTYNFEPQVPNQYIDDFKHDINYTLENPGHIYAVDTYSPPVQQNDTAPQMALGQSDSSASSAHKQWFGDHQTIPEMLAALSQNTALSLEQKDQLYKQVLALTNDPSTPYYNKYSAPTSDAVKYIAKLGIDVSGGVNDAWLEKNKYLLNYGLYTATGTTPSKPSGSVNSSNIMQWLAYDYAQIAKDYKATQAVSTEIAALKDEIAFKANRADRNMSDQEIMDSIDWAGKYKNLNKIKEGADTGFVGNYTSALDFDFDYLPVYIWQARNNGGTGDALVDGIKAALGQGNQWQENAQIANELDPNSENYKPFSHGSTLDADDLIRMGGVSEITPGMVADLKAKTDWNNDADVKFYNKVAAAEANTEKAEAQLQEFNQRIDAMLYLGGITDPAQVIDNALDGLDMLKKMEDGTENPSKIPALTRSVDFSINESVAKVSAKISEQLAKSSLADFSSRMAQIMHNSGVDAISGADHLNPDSIQPQATTAPVQDRAARAVNDAKTKAIQTAAPTILKKGTDDEKLVFSLAGVANAESYAADLAKDVQSGTTDIGAVYTATAKDANAFDAGHYLIAKRTVAQYGDMQKQLAEMQAPRDQLVQQRDQAVEQMQGGIITDVDRTEEEIDGVTHVLTADYDAVNNKYIIHDSNPSDDEETKQAIADYDMWLRSNLNMENYAAGRRADLQVTVDNLTAQINVLNGDIERQETAIKGYQKLYDQAQDDIKTSQTKNQAVAMVDVLAKNPQVDFTTPEGQRELAEATARNASLASSIDLVMDIGSQYKPTQWSPDTVFQEMQSNGASQATMTQAANAIIAECDRDIAALTQAMDQMQAAGAQIPKEYTSNLNREMEKQQSRKQTAEDFLLQNKPDFTESVTDKTADVLRATADGKREYNSLTQDVASRLVGADNIPDAYFTSDARKNQYDTVASMREDELKTYMYKLDKEGETAAWEYFRSIQETLQVRSTIAQNEELADFAKEYPVLAAITSIGISPATTKAAGYTAVSLLSGQEINPYNRFFDSTWAANTLDQTAKETILAPLEEGSILKKIAGIGYDAVTSGAKSLLNSALTAPFVGGSAFWGAVPMGVQAAGAAAQETKLSGGSDLQAAEMAGVTFLAETLSETITTRNISEAVDKGAKGVKAVMKKALGNDMVEEFVGEAANQAVESIADTAIMGELSQRNQRIKEYEQIMSHEEAVKQADKDFWKGVLSAGITGALSAAGTTGAGYIGGRLSSIGASTNTTTPTAGGQARAYALENGLPLDYARNDQTARTLSMLTSALNANKSSQTMALGAALMPATGDQQSQNAAVSAGLRLADRFGPEQAISTAQSVILAAEQEGASQDAVRSAMTVAALGQGEAAQVLNRISNNGAEFGDVQALIDAAGRDAQNPAITDRMQAIIHNDRVSMRTRDLIGDGALNGVQPYAENVRQKQAEVEITAKNTEQEHDRLQAMGDNLKTLNDEHNAAPDNQAIAGKLTQATKDLTGQIKVAQEYDQSLEQKQQQLDDAQKQLDQVTNDAMTKTREQAMADVAAQEQAEAEAALAEATQAEAEAEAPASNPNVSTAYTNSQVPVSFHYALVPASDLITSNTDTYEANPAYPAELQPRDRTRAASQDQISGMVRSLNPARLGESADVQNGAPIVGTDNVVESGNARTMAIRQAMANNPQSAARYTAWLRENAARFGLNPADVLDNSVLVRVRDTDLDRAAFARAANESTTAGYSPSENAQTDADKLTPRMMELFAPADNGSLSNTDNHAFVLAFLNEIIPESERGAYMQQDGTISQQGYERIRNAVFQRAYGNTALTQALTEDTDGTAKNVMNALLKAAPRMMALQELVDQGAAYDVGLASKIAEAAQRYIELRNAGMDVETYLNQTAMPGIQTEDEGTQALMRLFEQYRRSGKKLAEALGNIADALEDAGDPRAMSFLGENTAPGLPELVRQGVARMEEARRGFATDVRVEGNTPTLVAKVDIPAGAEENAAGPDRYTYTMELPGSTPPSGTDTSTPGTATPESPQRQFGSQTAQRGDLLHEEVKEYLREHSDYDPDSNKAQLQRASQWVTEHATAEDPDGYHGAVAEIQSADYNFLSADGQARMLTLMSMAAMRNDVSTEVALADAYNKQGTVLGQALQSRNIFNMMSPLGRQSVLLKEVDRINQGYADKGKETRVSLSPETLEAAGKASTPEEFAQVQRQAYREMAEQMPPTWKDQLQAWRMLSMLGNPRTHIRNMLGNAVFMPAVKLKNVIGAGLEAMSDHVGKESGEMKTKSLTVNKENRDFAKADALKMKDTLTGEAKYNADQKVNQERKIFGAKDNLLSRTVGKALQWLSDKNSEYLEKEDWAFLHRHYENALGGWMTANNLTPDTITPAQLNQAREYAINEAQKATYRDASKIASMLSKVSQRGGFWGWVADAAIPFKKTPANILKRGIEYSPVGLVRTLVADTKKVQQYNNWVENGREGTLPKNAISPTQYIDRIASGLSGTAITALGALLSSLGVVTVGYDKDKEELEKLEGKQKYALNFRIGDADVSYTIDWAAPVCMPFFVGASLHNAMEGEIKDVGQLADALLEITEPVFNLSMLDGVNSLIQTSQWSSGTAITQMIEKTLSNYASSFLPTLAGQASRTIDPVRRKAYVESGASLSTWRYALEQAQNKTPYSVANIPYRNVWGEEDRSPWWMAAFENFISPGYISEIKPGKLEQELSALFDATGDKTAIPKSASKSLSVNGQNIKLNAEQYDQFVVARGTTAKAVLEELMARPEWAVLDANAKIDLVDNAWDYANETARKKLFPDAKTTSWIQAAQEKGNPADAILERHEAQAKKDYIDGYKTAMFKAVDEHDYESFQTSYTALMQAEIKDAQDNGEKVNMGYVNKQLTNHYKPLYKKAVLNGDAQTAQEIKDNLMALPLYTPFTDDTFSKWLK